ncbi:MAG: hypothetical protein EP305_06615 [Bacteroidetes bacterium]|nr:MAG: hypothetical protein EP305_06615 [Bacteroidota bacterium]
MMSTRMLFVNLILFVSFLGLGQECLTVPSRLSKTQNEYLVIKSTCDLYSFSMNIYSRWGDEIYSTEEFQDEFDLGLNEMVGKKKKEQREKFTAGVYFYIIEYQSNPDSESIKLTGNITIL